MPITIWVILEIVFFLMMLAPLFYSIRLNQQKEFFLPIKRGFAYFGIAILIYCLFDQASGDYLHYQEALKEWSISRYKQTHMEKPYVWIAQCINYNYFLFRLIIWGTAILLLIQCINKLKIRRDLALGLFILFHLQMFSYGRVSLGLSCFFLGYIMFITSNKKTGSLKGLILILLSCFLHKSIFVLLAIFPFCFINLSVKKIILSLLCLPFFIVLFNSVVQTILSNNIHIVGANYLQKDIGIGIGFKIYYFLIFISTFPLFIYLIKYFSSAQPNSYPIYWKRIYNITYIILYVSTILSFLNIGHVDIAIRIRQFAFLPLSFLITYYITNVPISKIKIILPIFIFFIADIYNLLYMFYWKLIGNY